VLMLNLIGMFDLICAFGLVVLNFFGIYQTTPELSFFGFYPNSLLVLYQVSIAISIHLLFLTQLDQLINAETNQKTEYNDSKLSTESNRFAYSVNQIIQRPS